MKIGILTHYYKSPNYGGNLQAFALVDFLRREGLDAEQICYDIYFKREKNKSSKLSFFRLLNKIFFFSLSILKNKFFLIKKNKLIYGKIKERYSYILKFNQNKIHHSSSFFGYSNIVQANDFYDAFITGSDQVWHPNNFCPAYLLSFVDRNKLKISYAASIAKKDLSKEEIDRLKKSITDYTAISVREKDSADLLCKHVAEKKIECVVDPVFLLSSKQWDEVAQTYSIDRSYLLTYFLGDSVDARSLAKDFARQKKLILVSMPFLNGRYRKCDWNYGDQQIFDAGPEHFISLIKNADCIFTDSFHATAFSVLYEKNFFVFPRDEKNKLDMSNRIESFLNTCNCGNNFCDSKEKQSLDYLVDVFGKQTIDLGALKRNIIFSKKFLLDNLK